MKMLSDVSEHKKKTIFEGTKIRSCTLKADAGSTRQSLQIHTQLYLQISVVKKIFTTT